MHFLFLFFLMVHSIFNGRYRCGIIRVDVCRQAWHPLRLFTNPGILTPLPMYRSSKHYSLLSRKKLLVTVDLNNPEVQRSKLSHSGRWVTGMVQLEFNPHLQSASTLASSSNTEVLVWDTGPSTLLTKWKVHSRPIRGKQEVPKPT